MSTISEHGTDCFEVEAFLHRNEVSKLFKVRHKATGRNYCMEVEPRQNSFRGPISSRVQEARDGLSKFWINLKFTFQTNSKMYYVLDHIGGSSLGFVYETNGPFTEDVIIFYICEIVVALEELHSHGLFYGELDLENILLDKTGHIVLWRNFCGKKYWTRQECMCNLNGFRRGNPCENPHGKTQERNLKYDFQLVGLVVLQLFSQDKLTNLLGDRNMRQERILRLVSKSDLLPSTLSVFARDLVTRLLKGQFYNCQHVRSHPIFKGINWKMVKARLTTPPTIIKNISRLPGLQKTTSEAYIRAQMAMNEGYMAPPYQVRSSSKPCDCPSAKVGHGAAFTDEALGASYPSYSPHVASPRLRSTLSSPDLSSFGQDMSDRQWTRDHYVPCSTGFPQSFPGDRYSHFQFSSVGSKNWHGFSRSMSDLSNIDNYDAYKLPPRVYDRPRTSSLIGNQYPPYSPPSLTTHHSFPPSNSDYIERINTTDRHTGDCEGVGGNGSRLYSNSYVWSQVLASRKTNNYPNNMSDISGTVPLVYRTEEYTRDLSHNTEGQRFSGYTLHRNSSSSDISAMDLVDDASRETYSRKFNENGQESFGGYSAPQRSRSCSDLTVPNDEEGAENSQGSVTDRRKNYPLAHIPIPSFEEFKRKNSPRSVEEGIKGDEKENFRLSDNRTNEKEEDISEKVSAKDRNRTSNFLTSKYSSERRRLKEASKSRSDPSGSLRDKSNDSVKESYYSQNDVIHNLMLKYGLYERTEKKRETTNNALKEKVPAKIEEFNLLLNTKKEAVIISSKNKIGHIESEIDSRPKIGRRASAVLHRDTPKLTHKSYSSISPSTALQLANEYPVGDEKIDINNNLKMKSVGDDDWKNVVIDDFLLKSKTKRDELRSKESKAKTRPEITISDVYKSAKHRKCLNESIDSIRAQNIIQSDKTLAVDKENEKTQKASKTLWAAAKDRLKIKKSPNNSPLLKRKDINDIKTEKLSNPEQKGDTNERGSDSLSEEKEDREPRKRANSQEEVNRQKLSKDLAKEDSVGKIKVSTDSSSQEQLRKNGIHSSLLSITSSLYSTDTDLDDSDSWQGELYRSEFGRTGNRKRWESFHSNVSVDSGSAHMFEFESDSIAAEMEDLSHETPEQEISENRKKSDIEVERTDSGIGGDIGLDHNYKRSWEDIVLKSSKHWSVVAASARHWQDLAKKNKKLKEVASRKAKSLSPTITEDMVECTDCQKSYVPEDQSEVVPKESSNITDTSVCTKCKERRVERKETIIELVQTEINYGNDLQILKEEFYIPLQSGGILQPDNLAAIFLNLQELVEVSTKFSRRLQKGLEDSVSNGNEEFSNVNVGSIFLESVELFQSYEIYCSKQNSASTLLDSLQKKNELLKIFLNVTCRENPKCRKMDLNSFLLAPVQRIMKYPLLLSRIRKTTPRLNQDREKLMQAQKKIEDQLSRINSLNSSVEPKQRRYRGSGHLGRSDSLDKLQMKKMASEILNWTMSELHLHMHGIFDVVIYEFSSAGGWNRRGGKKAVDVFMLFCIRGLTEPQTIDSDEDNTLEDPLFPSDSEATDAALVMLRKKMNGKYTLFKEPLSLDTCVICKDSEHKDSFEIINMSRETYVFKATGNKQRKKWLKHLRLQAKDLGIWKKRRNGLPNIMIKNI